MAQRQLLAIPTVPAPNRKSPRHGDAFFRYSNLLTRTEKKKEKKNIFTLQTFAPLRRNPNAYYSFLSMGVVE
jgi:hypothetical protein